jgi:hypothetical protein
MVLGTGLGSQLSIGTESTYGTAGTLNHYLPADKVSIKQVQNIVQGGGFQGNMSALGTRRRVTTKGAAGPIETQILNRGMGLFCQNLMGTTVTPVQISSTTAYTQTHTWATNTGKSLTIQSTVPSTDGTANPYTYKGCKFPSVEFTYEVGANLMATWDVDARDVTEATAVPAASYTVSTYQFVGTDTGVTVGTYGSTAPASAATGVSKVSVKFERPMKTDRYYFGTTGLKSEPLQNDFYKISGVITADFVDKTLWADRFAAQTGFSLQFQALGSAIGSSGQVDTFQVTLPCVYLDGDTRRLRVPMWCRATSRSRSFTTAPTTPSSRSSRTKPPCSGLRLPGGRDVFAEDRDAVQAVGPGWAWRVAAGVACGFGGDVETVTDEDPRLRTGPSAVRDGVIREGAGAVVLGFGARGDVAVAATAWCVGFEGAR